MSILDVILWFLETLREAFFDALAALASYFDDDRPMVGHNAKGDAPEDRF